MVVVLMVLELYASSWFFFLVCLVFVCLFLLFMVCLFVSVFSLSKEKGVWNQPHWLAIVSPI